MLEAKAGTFHVGLWPRTYAEAFSKKSVSYPSTGCVFRGIGFERKADPCIHSRSLSDWDSPRFSVERLLISFVRSVIFYSVEKIPATMLAGFSTLVPILPFHRVTASSCLFPQVGFMNESPIGLGVAEALKYLQSKSEYQRSHASAGNVIPRKVALYARSRMPLRPPLILPVRDLHARLRVSISYRLLLRTSGVSSAASGSFGLGDFLLSLQQVVHLFVASCRSVCKERLIVE